MQQVFTDESLTRADRASRLISGRDVLFGAAQTTKQYHADGYVNVLNQYGTQNDTTEQYEYSPDGGVMDVKLTQMYEGDGLFAKIIDTPADECVKHGFSFSNLSDEKAESFLRSALDDLDWEDCFSTAVKWSRLFGGAIGVMLIDDGGELDEPLNWGAIKSIDEIRIYERAIVQPDYTSLYRINPQYDGNSRIQSKFGMPQYYTVMSQYGSFVVHESRCLIFRNGRLPERTSNPLYQIWGMPEYIRIKRSMRDATIAHGDATKLLERSVQAVYSMKGLADECSTEEGENRILKRLQTIDTSRGLMNTISIDADGENYDFKTFSFSGVSDVVDTSCNMLSALTNIPQTILFGRSPAGMSATGESDMENYYNFVGRIQKTQLRQNFQILLDVIVQAGVHSGELDKAPDIHIEFNPLWSLSDAEQAQVESAKAQTASTRANTALAYINAQVLDPTEVRRKLAESGEFNVEDIITEDDIDEDDILKAMNAPTQQSANPTVEGELANKPQQLQQQNQPSEQPDNQTSSKPKLLTKGHFSKYSDGESSRHSWDSVDADGGPGSGNFNHGGRPGEIGGSSPSLSDAEVKSIVRYTGTNEHLSDEDKYNIESAIKKSPPLDPELSYQRGLALKPSELKDFIEKGIYEPKDLTSWSNSESVAYNRCVDLNWGDKVNVILSYNGKKQLDNGISVTEWSQNPDEDEVIFGSGAKMRIAKDEIYGIDEETGTADPESTVYINLYDDENTDSADFNSDYDKPAKDIDWITVNGTHTPLQEGKAIGGGKLNGKDFSKATVQKKTARHAAPTTSNTKAKCASLNARASSTLSSNKSEADKASELSKMFQECESGTTFKFGNTEYRKTDNPEAPFETIDSSGNHLRYCRHVEDWDINGAIAGKSGYKLEFFDKEEQLNNRKQTAAKMKESGKFSTSEEVHSQKEGKITDTSSDFGKPGNYVVYRNGVINRNGMIFLSPKKETADTYSSQHDEGNTSQYEVQISNPLVVKGETDGECLRNAYEALHPGSELKGPMTESKWVSTDKKNAAALDKGVGGHDSILYIRNGKPWEVQISAKKAKSELQKTGEFTTTKWSRTGRTYEQAVMAGMIDETAEDYKKVNSDGGPGSGNFGHEGRPGKVGGAAGSETTQTSKTSSHGSSKNFQSLIPSDSYTNTTDYQNASKTFKSALKKRDEIDDKRNAVKKELESESHPKPRSEWTEDDEIYDMLGDRPMVYTDKGKELKAQSDKLFKEWSAADHELTEAGDRLRDIKKKAHDEQIKSVYFDKPVKASSDDYEGFTTKTTGTGYDEYLNGKQNGGYVAEMSPAEYLQRCAYQVFENATIESTLAAINEKNVDEYAKKMESGEKFDMPYLNLEKSEQEGRHRAAAAMKAGIEKIPVLVVGYKQNADSTDTHGSVGVLVIKDGRILCGIRSGNTAPGCICGPGGHIENGETPEQAAIRETQEEFGITPKDLVPIGNGPAESDTGYSPNLFLCTDYNGEPNCTSDEMSWAQFVDLDRFANNPPSMFQPFADSIICLLDAMSGSEHEDGGPGSGHFGHESEKGKRGGSIKSHVRLEGCSDSTKTLIDEALENPYGYGGIDTEARKQSIRSALEKDGVKVTVDEDGLSMAFSPKFSYDDCIDANIAMNGYNMLGRKDYIRQCNDAGSEPLLHETPEALQYVDKPDDGSLSIYDRFNSYNALNDDDIVKYGAFDHDQNPNGNEALTKASISAIESLTPEQHEALVDYTQQYGAATYTEINHYLTSPDEEKTGYSDVVAKNAAAITKALDKEIGADCLVSRGQSDLIGIAPDKKLENYVKQISKCNFKNASKLKQALEGKVIQNDAVMSTSAGNSAGDYSACSVQLLLKTPAKAKAVDLSAISAYGTHSEIEKALASAMGQSLSYEHEVAFKPETQYKIESVDIGFRPASAGRKKPSAYVYITGTVLTDDERTDGVFFAGELDDHDV